MPVLRPITVAAYLTGRHRSLIRRWAYTGRLTTTACDTHTRALLVDLTELAHLTANTQQRRRAA